MLQEQVITKMENSLIYLMKNYAAYNSWANKTTIDWLRTKPSPLMDQEVQSSFPSIKQTIIHILQTQRYWFSIIRKDENYVHEPIEGSAEEVFDMLAAHSAEMEKYIGQMTGASIQGDNRVVNPWFECNFPNFEYIQHCINHTTYHRGQIVTMGRILGITDAPMTDYNFYNVRAK